jgi:hypothetical protein
MRKTAIVAPLTLGAIVCLTLLTGCASKGNSPAVSSTRPSSPVPAASSSGPRSVNVGPVAAPCADAGCRPGSSIALTAAYSVRLWSSLPPDQTRPATLTSTPVVELLKNSQHLQWWTAEEGFGWAAHLTCLASGPQPNCMVVAEVGAHAGAAQMLLLAAGKLDSPARTHVIFDSGAPTAADLNRDGYLDLVGSNNDFKPNFATGHNFWVTYRFVGDAMVETGCTPRPPGSVQAPTQLLTGHCPTPPSE